MAPPRPALCSSTGQYLAMEKEREVDVCILMLKWFDMLGIIAGSAVGGKGRGGGTTKALRPNVTKSDLEKWKVRNSAPATQTHAYPTFMLQQRGDQTLWGVGWRITGQRFLLQDVHTTAIWVGDGNALTLQCHVSAVQQEAHLSVLMQVSTWEVGVEGEVFATPTCSPLAKVDKEREKRGVMVMPQLMEISCQGWGAGGPEGLGCGCTDDTEALAPVFWNAAAFLGAERFNKYIRVSVQLEFNTSMSNSLGIGILLCHSTNESLICWCCVHESNKFWPGQPSPAKQVSVWF